MRIDQELKKLIKEKAIALWPELAKEEFDFVVERPKEMKFGDWSSNIGLVLAKKIKKSPMEVAEKFVSLEFGLLEKAEVVQPGFINFFLKDEWLGMQVKEVLDQGEEFGKSNLGNGERILVEFISANPTGPLTIANGRGGFTGDVLSNVLALAGYNVEREFYINDSGNQVKTLGKSVLALAGLIPDEEDYYHGEYLGKFVNLAPGNIDHPEILGQQVANELLKEIHEVIESGMKIKFDHWFSEQNEVRDKGLPEKTIEQLRALDLVFKEDGALWLHTTKFGDDKDRVIIKKDGNFTYCIVDLAYHIEKIHRGFTKLIDIWGADHHGYIERTKAGLRALGHQDQLDIIIVQMVRLISKGKEVRMSKRAGNYVEMKDLLDDLGHDVVRWFFLMYASNTHMDFDLDLAKEKSEKNPVFYVQYAHARLCGILSQISDHKIDSTNVSFEHASEKILISVLNKWPEVIEEVAKDYQVHKLTQYARELAEAFHGFYHDCRVIDNGVVNENRLALIEATKVVLGNVLKVVGVEAPEKM
jgi:arginyl-tRNA synthetase